MTSCGGTSNTRVRRSTRTACWMPGMITISPGPKTRWKRPRKNTTARSYSRRILIDIASTMTRRTIAPRTKLIIARPPQ
jgi:hypothetical protein